MWMPFDVGNAGVVVSVFESAIDLAELDFLVITEPRSFASLSPTTGSFYPYRQLPEGRHSVTKQGL